MKHLSRSGAIAAPEAPFQVGDTRLHGTRLVIARVVWVTLVLLAVGVFIAALFIYYLTLHGVIVPGDLLRTHGEISGYAAIVLQYTPLVDEYSAFNVALINVLALVWIATGVVIFWKRSDDWMALLVALSLILLGPNFSPVTSLMAIVLGSTSFWGILITCIQALACASFGGFFALFPDGRFVPRRMHWVLPLCLAAQLPLSIPLSWEFSDWQWSPVIIAGPFMVTVIVLLPAQLYRYHRVSSAVQRQQTKWVLFGMIVVVPMDAANILPAIFFPALRQAGPAHTFYVLLSEVTFPSVLLLIPLSICFAMLRYRLWDVDLVINRTLVYGLLTASVVALYLLVVVGLGTLLSTLGNLFFSLLATGIIAVLFHPLRERLQRAVNRLMFGERDDPYRLIMRLGQHLETTLAGVSVLPTIVETVAQALKLSYVAITWPQRDVAGSLIAASYGDARADAEYVRVPLVYQQKPVGEIVLAPRSPGEPLAEDDQRLLHALAQQVSVAVHAVRLTADLQRLTRDLQQSREQLVLAREEERRRLRRDLHDGLGPQLASLTLKLETARNRLGHDHLADTLLSDLITRTQEAVADVRRLVHALRPPALDALGLLPALHEQLLQYSDQGNHAIHMSLETPNALPLLPAAVEVAIFRIAQEALTNVIRHSQASRCSISLSEDEREQMLNLEIRDNGRGLPLIRGTGVGLTSMRERAEELGGTWGIESLPSGGICIRARLPCSLSSRSAAEPKPLLTSLGEQG